MSPVLILVTIAVVLISILWSKRRFQSNSSSAPGPPAWTRLPLVGHGYLLGKNPIAAIERLRKKYGDLFRLDIGQKPTIWLCQYDIMHEAVRTGALTGRPYKSMPIMRTIKSVDSKGSLTGTVFSTGKSWQEQRRFMHATLNDLGMGRKDTMETIIEQEAMILGDRLRKNMKEKPTLKVSGFFLYTINNVIWRMITGKRTKYDDPELVTLTEGMLCFFDAMDPGSFFNILQLYCYPFAWLVKHFLPKKSLLAASDAFRIILLKEIAKYEADLNGYFIERYKAEIERHENKPDSSFFNEDGRLHMLSQLGDIFGAGTDTTSTALEWLILYMTEYEEIQEAVHQSIRECFGLDGAISLQDQHRLPLVMAVIDEIGRHCNAAALGVPQETEADIEIGGIRVPNGTQVYFFTPGIHYDPKLFSDPDKFDPYRFLDEHGQYVRDEHVIFFGFGKRKCVGEKLGRAELFLFQALILQKFRFRKVSKDQVLDFVPVPGLAFHPKPFEVVVEERQ